MKLTDALETAGGIITALIILVLSVFPTMFVLSLRESSWAFAVPFVVLVLTGAYFWKKQREDSSPFATGGLIGACIALLVCSACDAWIFTAGFR